jgi:hypothetical protein
VFRWGTGGKEIVMANGTNVLSIPVRERRKPGDRRAANAVFQLHADRNSIQCFDITRDGKRFLALEGTGAVAPVALVQNWAAGLK